MVEPDDEERWPTADDEDELQAMLDPHLSVLTEASGTSTAVNKPGNDSPEIIESLDHDQSGHGSSS